MGTYLRTGGYSSNVAICLVVNGEQLDVAQVGPSQLILRDRRYIAPGTTAEIIIDVDGIEERHPITIDEGYAVENDVVNFSEGLVPF